MVQLDGAAAPTATMVASGARGVRRPSAAATLAALLLFCSLAAQNGGVLVGARKSRK
eukprot:SAG22_NODE_4751_length_1174_cov_2.093023_1_plen_56_part_10